MNKNRFAVYVFFVCLLFGIGCFLLKTDKAKISLPVFNLPSFSSPTIIPTTSVVVSSDSAELATVLRVVDGDTIELNDKRKVRYLGIDTPELHHPTKGMQCFGQEAMEKNKALVEGKTIKMVRDVSETDRYKRLLRYIWVGDIFVNEYLVKEGYAFQSTFPPDVKYAELFRKTAEEARINNKGLWKSCK